MNATLREAFDYCRQAGIARAIFAVPFPLSVGEMRELTTAPVCGGAVLQPSVDGGSCRPDAARLGRFQQPGDWRLPSIRGVLVFLGAPWMLTRKMLWRVVGSGRLSIVCKIDGRFSLLKVRHLLFRQAAETLRSRLRRLPPTGSLRTCLNGAARVPLVRTAWRRLFRPNCHGAASADAREEQRYVELTRRAADSSAAEKIQPVPGRVVLVNAGLAAGGAERQIVNTLNGLRDDGRLESVALLAEYIDYAPQLDFLRHELRERNIEVAQVRHSVDVTNRGLASLPASWTESAADLPYEILEEILNLAEEFRVRRPEVVHAWQDSTCIKAGFAAVLAGVPRVVLASRNMIPTNFTYYRDFMRPAYRALAALDSVVLLNNSEAGAADYAAWLGLPRERFTVVRNGVDLGGLHRASLDAVRDYRLSLGIPLGAQIVGSVFRFWAEKRPQLWLQSAAILAERYPHLHFLLIGDGPLRGEMEQFVRERGLGERVHLPGVHRDVAIPLSALDVFLLTSQFEGTPNVVLEAQRLGLPVVATDAGGTRETFLPGITGSFVSDPDPGEIAAQVGKYLKDERLQAQAREHGPAFVEERYGLQRMIQETLSVYDSAAMHESK